MTNDKINRREFVKTAIGAAASAGALSQIAFGQGAHTGRQRPDQHRRDRRRRARRGLLEWAIKTGQQEKTPAQVVAVCDVYAKRLRLAKEFAKCDGYLDYREIIDRKDIDAVIIATPDHWHETMASRP